MDLGRYFKVIMRWWWLILLSILLSGAASYIYSQDLPRIYAAKTTLVVGVNVIENPNPDTGTLNLSRTLAEVYSELVRRPLVTQAVIDRLGLDMSAGQLAGMIQTNIIPSAQLLEVIVLDVHPQRAQLLANAVAEELILQSPTGAGEQQERDKFIRTQLQDLQAKIEETDKRIAELEDSLQNMVSATEIAEARSQLAEQEGLRATYQSNYTQFLANLSESSINRLAVFEPASEPFYPVSPNVTNNVLLAVAAGLALAVSAIVLLEFFSDTLTWQGEESQGVLNLPLLGAIGKISDNPDGVIVRQKRWSPVVDTFRNLRSNIFLAAQGQKLTTLLVTSTIPGEGKSFTSSNLAATIASPNSSIAAAMAAPGARVILVDADLRKPSLHEKFDMPNLLGLVDVLAAPDLLVETMLDKALRPTDIDNLYLLPAGRTPLDPGYALNSPRLAEVLNILKARADLVVMDSAPLLSAAETRFLARAVDGIVLVVNDGRSRRRAVQKAIASLQTNESSKLLGVVFNSVGSLGKYDYYTNGYDSQSSLARSRPQGTWFQRMWRFGKSRPGEDGVLTLPEVANYLGVSQGTVNRWRDEGRIPAVKTGRHWSVRVEELNEFIASYQPEGVDNVFAEVIETQGVQGRSGSNGIKKRV